MSYAGLEYIWFAIWGLIWALYFVLDGYSLGTGMLYPFLGKNEQQERQLQESIGPFWGVNEVWLITAGGVTFAAFAKTYAVMFSTLYVPMFLILFALFFRAVGLEFMHKHESASWRSFWKWAFFSGSSVIALLFGVAFSNLYIGLELDKDANTIPFFSLLNGYAILGGLTFIALFLLSGSVWISWKTVGELQLRASVFAKRFWYVACALFALFLVASVNQTPLFNNYNRNFVLWIVPIASLLAIFLGKWALQKQNFGGAVLAMSGTIGLLVATGFIGIFPNMLPSRINPEYSVTLYQAAASELNLKIMLIVTILILPIIIIYQVWMYRLFRRKITPEHARGYH